MPNIYLSYLAAIFLILNQKRMYGEMSLEDDADYPDQSDIFQAYPELRDYPIHFAFVLDSMRMIAKGIKGPDLEQYADAAEHAMMRTKKPNVTLWELIRNTLLTDHAPYIAVLFGRQAMPFELRPPVYELQALMKSVRKERDAQAEVTPPPLKERVATWFARADQETISPELAEALEAIGAGND